MRSGWGRRRGSGIRSEDTRQVTSPVTPSDSRLVARMWRRGQLCSNALASPAQLVGTDGAHGEACPLGQRLLGEAGGETIVFEQRPKPVLRLSVRPSSLHSVPRRYACVVTSHGTTSAVLQIVAIGAHCRLAIPVTIRLRETNGRGLVLARGSTSRDLPCSATALPLAGVLADTGMSLASVTARSSIWVNDAYEVQVRQGKAILGSTIFHLAR
jgi:hypothetical protein